MNKWTRNNGLLLRALASAGVAVPEGIVAGWSDRQAVDAEVWALATHLKHPEIPPGKPPHHVEKYVTVDGSPAGTTFQGIV